MMRDKKTIIMILGVLSLVWFVGMLLPVIPSSSAANNQSVLAKVNVSNTNPYVFNVTVTPQQISLTPGTTTNVTCNGTIQDYNGVPTDILGVNATLYLDSTGPFTALKNDTKYFVNCYNVTTFSTTSALYTCDFNVWYFARNGTWVCNMTAWDTGNLNGTNANTTNILPLIALNVTDIIDYGIVPVLNISGEQTANVTNFGNIPINISVRGWGGQNESLYPNLSMVCELGNISLDMERYNLTSGQAWANMKNLTDTNAMLSGMVIQIKNDTFTPKNTTYWRISIPPGVGGICNGTVLFTATNSQG